MFKSLIYYHLVMLECYIAGLRFIVFDNKHIYGAYAELKNRPKKKTIDNKEKRDIIDRLNKRFYDGNR